MEEIMEGVKTRTLGAFAGLVVVVVVVMGESSSFLEGGERRAVRSGRKAWMVRIGWRRWVLKRSAKLEGGMVAMGEVV